MELAACCLAWWNTDVKRQTNCQEINSKTCNSHSSFLESQHQSDLCIKTNRVVLPPIKKQKSYCPWCRRTCNWFHANLALPSSAIVYHANWRRMRRKSQCLASRDDELEQYHICSAASSMFNFKAKEKEIWKVQLSCSRRRNNYFSWPRANCKGKKLSSHMQHIRVRNPKGQLTLQHNRQKWVLKGIILNRYLLWQVGKWKTRWNTIKALKLAPFKHFHMIWNWIWH